MTAKLAKIFLFFLNLSIFIGLTQIIFHFLWNYFGRGYVFGSQTIGSDYFNALTYQLHFAKYNPHPITGWLPFWNEGASVIGGYPPLTFYLANFLTELYEPQVAMNIFSFGSLFLFFASSLLLFWQVSKNWLVAFALTVVATTTQASYYQLTVGGFMTSAATQWYLPASLYLLFKFHEATKTRYLVFAAILVGFSLISHGPTGFLMILLPSIALLFFLPHSNMSAKVKRILLFASLAIGIGFPGLATMITKTFLGSGSGTCASPECWGLYPKHLILWLTPISPILVAAFIPIGVMTKIFKKPLDFSLLFPASVGFLSIFLYSLAAYLKLINGLANVIFPTRTFWAANLFILLVAASLFASVRKSLGPIFSYLIAALTLLVILAVTLTHPFQIKTGEPNTTPRDISSYITAREKQPIGKIIPDWILRQDPNFRIDIFNPSVNQWFNTISQIPLVGGYSNQSPLAIHQDWQYFLQSTTRGEKDDEMAKNQALFLIDAFAVKSFENTPASYIKSITEDSSLIVNKDIEWFWVGKYGKVFSPTTLLWYQLSDEVTTPIVSPTNAKPVLFVGDDKGYENFIRTIAMTNLNSKIFIPVRGPKSPDKLTKKELEIFPAIVLYQYQGQALGKLAAYAKDGGRVFIDTGPIRNLNLEKTPEIIPLESLATENVSGSPDWQKRALDITDGIDTQKFSDLTYENGPWRITTGERKLKPWAKELLSYQNHPVLAGGQLGNGYIIWSGLNLPFHIIDNNNLEEAKLFKNILTSLIDSPNTTPVTFNVQRQRPESIRVEGENFSGIYFKENYDPGWKAHDGENNLKVYRAGLEFMYIPVSQSDGNMNIDIVYKGTATAWILASVTAILATISALFVLLPKLVSVPLAILVNFIRSKFKQKLETVLEDE